MLTKIKRFTLICALIAGTFLLSACNEYTAKTNKKIETTLERTEDLYQRAQIPDLPEQIDTVRTKNDIWLGTDSIKITEGDTLPAWLEADDSITIAIAEEATLPTIAQELTEMTGIAIRLDDLKAEEKVPDITIPVNYTGKLSGFLDYLSNRFGVWWRYRNGIVSFFNTETRVFNIYALPTETTISTSLSGATMGQGGGGSSSSTLSSSANLVLWDNIEEGVKQIVAENGKLSFSRVAGTVTVTASPFIVRKVGNYIETWNQKLSRQVALSIKVLQVTLNNEDNYGLDLGAVFDSSDIAASFTSPYTIASSSAGGAATAGLLSMTLIKPNSKWRDTAATIQAFSSQGKTSLVTSATATTLNNKVAPIQITTQENYVKETNVTSSGSGSDRSTDVDMETDTLNYGFMMEILPRILDHGRLIVMFSLNLTDLISLETFSSNGVTNDGTENDENNNNNNNDTETTVVQLPKMQTRGFLQEIAMRSGSTLVLTGFERVQDTVNSSGIGRAKMGLLGGQAYSKNTRDVLVILLTPEVLESPLSAESRMRDY